MAQKPFPIGIIQTKYRPPSTSYYLFWVSFIFLLLIVLHSSAQNLVPNPSFEDTISCPHFADQIDKALGWHASRNSPDYFNQCDWLTGNQAVPNNIIGFQYAHSGNAYAGLISYSRNGANYREHFSCNLQNALIIGKKYLVSYYLSLANNYSNLASNKLGALFSTLPYDLTSPSPINNVCQFYSDSIISDTLNWIKIEGSFIADSAYSFLTIGNFFNDTNTDTIYTPPASHCYYFIDDISVIEDTATSDVENNQINQTVFYPNPVIDKITIQNKFQQVTKIEIINLLGEIYSCYKTYKYQQEIDIDLSSLPKSLFYLRIHLKNNSQFTKKVIKL